MSRRNTFVRTLHDVGLAAWFGGTLMGAVGVNGASRDIAMREERVPVATDAWGRFTPTAAVAIGAHLVGAVGLLVANRGRVRNQEGVATASAVKTVLTGAALGSTAYAWFLGTKLGDAGSVSATSGTVPSGETPPDVVRTQQQMRVLQWAIPATTGGIIAMTSLQGEMQRGDETAFGTVRGVAKRQQRKADRMASRAGSRVRATIRS